MRASLACFVGAAGIVTAGLVSPALAADDLNSVVRTLNAVLNPGDARRFEDQARRNGRADEERYWHNYGAGLEEQRRGGGPQRSEERRSDRIGPEEARRLEEQARRNGRREDERYWHNYAAGFGSPRPEGRGEIVPQYRDQNPNRIGPEQASRLEEQARRNGRWEEVRYWADYRASLEGRSR